MLRTNTGLRSNDSPARTRLTRKASRPDSGDSFSTVAELPAVRCRCSTRTWIYRVAHHVAASHVLCERRTYSTLVSLEELETLPDKQHGQRASDQRINLERLSALIQQLKPLDRQVIISYLEDMDAVSIGEITGLSPGNVAMRIHRIKNILARRFHEGGSHAE